MTCGTTPKNSSLSLEPPEDFIDSRGPSSIPSITSEDSLPSVPIEWIPTAKVPVRGPKPVIGSKTKARISSGKALMIFNTCLVILLREFNDTLFVPPYHNDTIMMNLKRKLETLGFNAYTGRYNGPMDLTNYKAVVHIPYAWSNLAFFEMFQLGIVYFIPTINFLFQLRKMGNFWFQPPYNRENLHLSEWYNDTHTDLLIYFDSWEDLRKKVNTLNYDKHKLKLKEFGEKHIKTTLNKWESVLNN